MIITWLGKGPSSAGLRDCCTAADRSSSSLFPLGINQGYIPMWSWGQMEWKTSPQKNCIIEVPNKELHGSYRREISLWLSSEHSYPWLSDRGIACLFTVPVTSAAGQPLCLSSCLNALQPWKTASGESPSSLANPNSHHTALGANWNPYAGSKSCSWSFPHPWHHGLRKSAPKGVISNCDGRDGQLSLHLILSASPFCCVPRWVRSLADNTCITREDFFSFHIEFIWICTCRSLLDSGDMPSFRLPWSKSCWTMYIQFFSLPRICRSGGSAGTPCTCIAAEDACLWLRKRAL